MSKMTKAALNRLAHSLAYESAVSVIESMCLNVSEEAGAAGWWQLPSDTSLFDDDLRYLEERGLIERYAEVRTRWISVRDESEATR